MNKKVLAFAWCALALAMSPAAMAEDSQEETPQEERDAAEKLEPVPERLKAWLDYSADLDRRYPDTAQVDTDKFMSEEGEAYALAYCKAAGFDGPCVVEVKDEQETLVPYVPGKQVSGKQAPAQGAQADSAQVKALFWWNWLWPRLFSVGVIPEPQGCPGGWAQLIQIHHDDEDRRNANGRGGWLGATTSTNNTTWRYCRIDTVASLSFRPLQPRGDRYDYAVLKLGPFCPSGGRRVVRRQNNEVFAPANWHTGVIFPSLQIPGFTWTEYCHFDGGTGSQLGQMAGFPKLGFGYGVHAPSAFPGPWALANGWVHQDDEDWFNRNAWFGWPDTVMSGGGNTWRGLAKVQW